MGKRGGQARANPQQESALDRQPSVLLLSDTPLIPWALVVTKGGWPHSPQTAQAGQRRPREHISPTRPSPPHHTCSLLYSGRRLGTLLGAGRLLMTGARPTPPTSLGPKAHRGAAPRCPPLPYTQLGNLSLHSHPTG